jgi:hypothetical protein
MQLTLVERGNELQRIDQLRVKTRGHLYSHACREENEVEGAKIWLLVPWYFVFVDYASENRIGSPINVTYDAHFSRLLGESWKYVIMKQISQIMNPDLRLCSPKEGIACMYSFTMVLDSTAGPPHPNLAASIRLYPRQVG